MVQQKKKKKSLNTSICTSGCGRNVPARGNSLALCHHLSFKHDCKQEEQNRGIRKRAAERMKVGIYMHVCMNKCRVYMCEQMYGFTSKKEADDCMRPSEGGGVR